MYKELLEVLHNNKVKYHMYKDDFLINVDVERIEVGNRFLKLIIPWGEIIIWEKYSKLIKLRRPSSLINSCKHCFKIFNQSGEGIGYVYC